MKEKIVLIQVAEEKDKPVSDFLNKVYNLIDQNVFIINLPESDETTNIDNMFSMGSMIYTFGDLDISSTNCTIIKGPTLQELKSNENTREEVKKDLSPGKDNAFNRMESLLNVSKKASECEVEPIKPVSFVDLSNFEERNDQEIQLSGKIEDAISGLRQMQKKNIVLHLKDLDLVIAKNKLEGTITYDELLGVLLVMNELGSNYLFWRGEAVGGATKSSTTL